MFIGEKCQGISKLNLVLVCLPVSPACKVDSFYWTQRNPSFPVCSWWGLSQLGTEALQQLSVSSSVSGLEAESYPGPFMLKFLVGSLVFMLYYGFPTNFDLRSWESHLHSAASPSLALIFHSGVAYLSKCDSSPNPPPTCQCRCRRCSNCYENR